MGAEPRSRRGAPGRSSWLSLAWAEAIFQLRIFSRSVVGAFFTLALPLLFLVLLNIFNAGASIEALGGLDASQFLTPAIAVFGMVTATFTSLAIGTTIARDNGVLKRVMGTPMPLSAHLAGRIASATIVGFVSVAAMLAVGWAFFGVRLPWQEMPLFFVLLTVGAATFSALGLAVASVTPGARAAPAVANAVILPLVFVSGIFFPLEASPEWVQTVARALPLEPLATAAVDLFNPSTSAGIPWRAFASLAAWGLVGMVTARLFFRWEPSQGGRSRTSVAD